MFRSLIMSCGSNRSQFCSCLALLQSLSSPSTSVDGAVERRPPRICDHHLGSISISLEDVALPGDSGSGIGTIRRKDPQVIADLNKYRTWSYDDLTLVKKQLQEPSPISPSDPHHQSHSPSGQQIVGSGHFIYHEIPVIKSMGRRSPTVMIPSPRRSYTALDNLRY